MNRGLFLFSVGLAFWCGSVDAYAKPPDDKLRQVEAKLAEKKQEEEALAAAALEASKGLEDLRRRMISSTKALQEKEVEQERLEEKLVRLTKEIAEKRKAVETERGRLSLTASALVEIASRPPESLFLQDKIKTDHIHRSLLFRAILPPLKAQAQSAAERLVALYAMQAELSSHEKVVAAARANLKRQQRGLDQMMAMRQGLLKRTEAQRKQTASHLASLAAEARDLRQLMQKVSTPRPSKPPPRATGALKWPVSGVVRKSFGEKDADGVVSEGLTLAASSGSPVVAPQAGRVVFAGPFRGYGQIMILQHAGSFYTFLSGFGRLDAELGQEVSAGEPLGVLPVKEGARPELYFEWRQGDKPVNPQSSLEPKEKAPSGA